MKELNANESFEECKNMLNISNNLDLTKAYKLIKKEIL